MVPFWLPVCRESSVGAAARKPYSHSRLHGDGTMVVVWRNWTDIGPTG
jgi:hypothetical protein